MGHRHPGKRVFWHGSRIPGLSKIRDSCSVRWVGRSQGIGRKRVLKKLPIRQQELRGRCGVPLCSYPTRCRNRGCRSEPIASASARVVQGGGRCRAIGRSGSRRCSGEGSVPLEPSIPSCGLSRSSFFETARGMGARTAHASDRFVVSFETCAD